MDTTLRRLALIVEDDPALQKAMTERLLRMDFEVKGALHYEAAVGELVAAGEPNLVCVDLELPTRSGYELCEYIRGQLGLEWRVRLEAPQVGLESGGPGQQPLQ